MSPSYPQCSAKFSRETGPAKWVRPRAHADHRGHGVEAGRFQQALLLEEPPRRERRGRHRPPVIELRDLVGLLILVPPEHRRARQQRVELVAVEVVQRPRHAPLHLDEERVGHGRQVDLAGDVGAKRGVDGARIVAGAHLPGVGRRIRHRPGPARAQVVVDGPQPLRHAARPRRIRRWLAGFVPGHVEGQRRPRAAARYRAGGRRRPGVPER